MNCTVLLKFIVADDNQEIMSTVKKLLQKTGSAPMRLPNHGTVEEQLAAIQAQKERTATIDAQLKNYDKKIKDQKIVGKNDRHKGQWIEERARLAKERMSAEQDFNDSIRSCMDLIPSQADPLSIAFQAICKEAENDVEKSKNVASATISTVMGISAKARSVLGNQIGNRPPIRSKDVQQEIEHVRKYFQDELSVLSQSDSLERAIQNDATAKMLRELADPEAADLETTVTQTEPITVESIQLGADITLATLRSVGPTSEDAIALFRGAINAETDRCQSRLEALIPPNLEGADPVDIDRVQMLCRAYDPHRNRSMFGKTKEELYERIVHDLPHLTLAIAQQYVRFLTESRVTRAQQRAALGECKSEVDRLLQLCTSVVQAAADAQEAEDERLRVAEEEARARVVRHEQIAQLRTAYDERQARELEERSADEERNRKVQERKDEARRAEYEHRLAKLAQHHAEKAEAEAKQREVDLEIEKLQREEQSRKAEANQHALSKRRSALLQRLDELRLEKLMRDDEVKRKAEALQLFFDGIQERIGVERDSSRVVQATVASAQTGGYVGAREASSRNVGGFTSERILKDPRFRIHQALVAANLHHTSYAREVMSSGFRVAPALATSANNPLAFS